MDVESVDFGSHGIIYVTQEKEKPGVTEWSNPATEHLLKILRKHYQNHSSGKFGSKRILYENCSVAMKKRGFKYAPSQCENKWKSLKRRYLTTHKRSLTGKGRRKTPYKRQLFDDEIEYILQFVQPEFKKEPEDNTYNSNRGSNISPGFDEEMDQDAENQEENNDSDENEPKYTHDEELVQRMLKDSDDEDQKDNVLVLNEKSQFMPPQPKPKLSEAPAETPKANNLLANVVQDLTRALKNAAQTNTSLLRSQGASYEQILVCLDSLDRKADQRIEMERKMLEQKKIQNTLLAKIVQRMGNSVFSNN